MKPLVWVVAVPILLVPGCCLVTGLVARLAGSDRSSDYPQTSASFPPPAQTPSVQSPAINSSTVTVPAAAADPFEQVIAELKPQYRAAIGREPYSSFAQRLVDVERHIKSDLDELEIAERELRLISQQLNRDLGTISSGECIANLRKQLALRERLGDDTSAAFWGADTTKNFTYSLNILRASFLIQATEDACFTKPFQTTGGAETAFPKLHRTKPSPESRDGWGWMPTDFGQTKSETKSRIDRADFQYDVDGHLRQMTVSVLGPQSIKAIVDGSNNIDPASGDDVGLVTARQALKTCLPEIRQGLMTITPECSEICDKLDDFCQSDMLLQATHPEWQGKLHTRAYTLQGKTVQAQIFMFSIGGGAVSVTISKIGEDVAADRASLIRAAGNLH